MSTLFEISDKLLALKSQLEYLEDLPEDQQQEIELFLETLLKDTEEERNAKIDNYLQLKVEFEAKAAARMEESKRLAALAKQDQNKAARLESALFKFFEIHNLKKVECPRFTVSLVNNGGKLPLILDQEFPVAKIPDNLCKFSREPDSAAIRTALEEGQELEFAKLGERGKHLRIK